MKDKESKIAFLDKLINAVSMYRLYNIYFVGLHLMWNFLSIFILEIATGKNITIRSAKIVAGLEVHKTLELLQLIGKAIDEKVK